MTKYKKRGSHNPSEAYRRIKRRIPTKFYLPNDENYPVTARTVEQLKRALEQLPNDLLVDAGFYYTGVEVAVINANPQFDGPAHLEIRKIKED